MRSFSSTRNLKTTSALTRISRTSTYRQKPEHRIPSDGVSPTGSHSPLGTLNNGPQDQKFIQLTLLTKNSSLLQTKMILSVQVLYLSLQPSSFLPNTPSRGLISTNRSFLRDSARILAHSGPKTKQRSILCSQRLHLKQQSRSLACIAGDTPHLHGPFHLPHCFHHRSHQPSKVTTLPSQSK